VDSVNPEPDDKGIDALIQAMIDNEDEFREALLAKVRAEISPARLPLVYDEVANVLHVLLPATFRALLTGEGLDEDDIIPVRHAAEVWATRGVNYRTVGEVGIACAEAAIMMTRVLARRSDLKASADLAVMVSFGRGVMIAQQCMTALFTGHARGMLQRRHRRGPAVDPTVAPVPAIGLAPAAGRAGTAGRGPVPDGRAASVVAAAARTPAARNPAVLRSAPEPGPETEPADEETELRQPGADILRMVAEGHTNVEIAKALHLSRQAVNYHVGRLMRALGASNRTALVARAYQRGLLLLTG
jgi:DNA-binding CsgD family transcriptional regulator